MDRKPSSDRELAALGKFKGRIDRSSNFRQQAIDHNLGRNLRVAQFLGYLALMRQGGALLSGIIDCVAATRQNFSSSQTMTQMGLPVGPTEAAHYLPGQIRIGGREAAQYAADLKTRGHIEFLFAEVEHLPAPFNQADTAAEAKGHAGGLCQAFVNACTALIQRPIVNATPAGRIPLDLVQFAYGEWHRDALTGLTNASVSKSDKPGRPPLVVDRFQGYTAESIAARSTASSTQWNRDESLRILGYYLEDQRQRTWGWLVGSCQFALREVESNFRG